MQTTTIRPGYLVSLSTRIVEGVAYERRDLAVPTDAPEGADVARWETTRVIADPGEHERARKVRGSIRTAITRPCIHSDFGLLCPEARAEDLETGVRDARAMAEEFNAEARTCHVEVYVLRGRIASDDAEAFRAVGAEMRGLLDEMQRGIASGAVEAIRDAASRAKRLGAMLDADSGTKVQAAVEEARTAARAIVQRVRDLGESVAVVAADVSQQALAEARFAFLDLDAPAAPAVAPTDAAAEARAAGLDLCASTPSTAPAADAARALDL